MCRRQGHQRGVTAGCAAGRNISPWHDIPLYLDSGLVNFVCEIPKESSAKMEVATVRALRPCAGMH